MMLSDAPVTESTLSIIGAVGVFVAMSTVSVMASIYAAFSRQRKLVYDTQKLFSRIISRHNREDDDRFSFLHAEIYNLRARNAHKDGAAIPEFKAMPRRLYLVDDQPDDADDDELLGGLSGVAGAQSAGP